jgi:hypothetical protein
VVVYEDMEKIRQTLAKSDHVQQEGEWRWFHSISFKEI